MRSSTPSSEPGPRPGLVSATTGLLAGALTAAAANLGSSLFDRPGAFEHLTTLADPLAVGFVLVLLAALLLAFVLRFVPGSLRSRHAAVGACVTLAGLLTPCALVLRRDVSAGRAPALWGLFAAALVLGTACAWFLGERASDRAARTSVLAAPLIALEFLAASWLAAYRGISPIAVWLGFALLISVTVVACRRAPHAGPILVFLAGFVVASPVVSLAGAGVASVTPIAPGGAPTAGAPPRIVLVTVDTLRPDQLDEAPAIRALLDDSVVFANARSAAPWTKPSVATILTGLSPLVHGTTARRHRLPPEVETLAESLRAAGYATAGLGLNVHLEPLFGFGQGFDQYRFPAREDTGTSFGSTLLQSLFPTRYPRRFPSTEAITDVALDWVRANAERPFFLWLHVLDPHWPYEPPDEFAPGPGRGRIGSRWGDHRTVTNVQAGNLKLGPADRERVRELYRGEIRYADANVGRLIALFEELDLYDDALIAFASDHGEEFWEHGTFEHGHTMYDEVLRVPLAFKLPGSAVRERVEAPVSTEAIVPTVLELAGVSFDAGRFGAASLVPWWTGGGRIEPSFGAATYYHGEKRAVVFEGKKLVLDLETDRVELFDLVSDPAERRSIAAAEPTLVARGLELLEQEIAAARELRRRLGLGESDVELSDVDRARLQALGYAGAPEPQD